MYKSDVSLDIRRGDEWTCQLLRDVLDHYADISIVGQARDGEAAVALTTLHQPDVISGRPGSWQAIWAGQDEER